MKFKELAIGAVFEFNHSGLPICHGLMRGSWEKTSTRKYIRTDTRKEYQVGTINVRVIED